MAWEQETEWFKDFDPLLRQLLDTEPAKGLLKLGGAIRLRWAKDHVDIHYDGGVFSRCIDRLEKTGGR